MLETHNVPATSVVKWDCSWGNSFASPKSAILASSLPSNRMLLALMSLCIIRGWSSSWRYASPRAVPMAMLKRVGQSISMASFGPPVLPKYTFYLEKKFFCTSWVCQITYPDMNLVVMWCLQLSLPLQFSPWWFPHKLPMRMWWCSKECIVSSDHCSIMYFLKLLVFVTWTHMFLFVPICLWWGNFRQLGLNLLILPPLSLQYGAIHSEAQNGMLTSSRIYGTIVSPWITLLNRHSTPSTL